MKNLKLIAAIFLCSITMALAQGKYFTKEGKVSFYSDAPLEKIEAMNTKASSVLDASTGQMEFAVLMKAFEFEKALMQEHFNENYVESSKYPKAVFKGKVDNIADVKFDKDGTYPVKVSGQMTLHGVTKSMTSNGTIEVKNGKIAASSIFTVLLTDYNIEIPKLVNEKISNEVKITVNMNYEPLAKG